MIRFAFDENQCTACGACAVACMDQNDIDLAGGQTPFRMVYRREADGVIQYISAACRHCDDAPCAAVCPTGSMYRDGETGLVLIEREKCVGCRRCAAACPYGAVSFYRRPGERLAKAEKCCGCRARSASGLLPACVRACPTGALACRTE